MLIAQSKRRTKGTNDFFCCCAIPYCSAGTHKSHHEKFVIVYSNLDFWKKYESFVKKMKKMRIFVGAMESGWYHHTYHSRQKRRRDRVVLCSPTKRKWKRTTGPVIFGVLPNPGCISHRIHNLAFIQSGFGEYTDIEP